MAHVDQDKKPNKKGSNGAISKTTKKPAPAQKSAPNSNQSTPKTARKGTFIQDDLLNKFIHEAIDLSQRQITDHSTPISALPSCKSSYQADTTKIRPLPEQSRVTPPKNQNKHTSHSPTTKKDSCIKKKMPTTVKILPRPSSGKSPLKFNARFDVKRTKSLLSEDVHHPLGTMDLVTYPGPVAMEDTNGEPLHFMGEVTFKINISGRVTTVGAWVTNEIPPGQLILGSGVLKDLNLLLQDIPNILSHSSNAEDKDTIKDPHGSSPVTREIVVGKKSAYYVAPGGARIKGKKGLGPYIGHFENFTEENCTFTGTKLPILTPLNQSPRQADPSRHSTSPTGVMPIHQ